MTSSSYLGCKGSGNGELDYPKDVHVAFDSAGNVYMYVHVADCGNHRIQMFTAKGQFLRKFGSCGSGDGELNKPCSISTVSDNVVCG